MSKNDLIINLNAIKEKLEQHAKQKNYTKVNEYLDKLDGVQMTIDLLKKTELGKTIQMIKKMENSNTAKASNLIKKWKSLINNTHEASSLSSNIPKKRLSSTQLNSSLPEKKQKISISDYKAKKGDVISKVPSCSQEIIESNDLNSDFNIAELPLHKSIIESLVQPEPQANTNKITQLKSNNDEISKFLHSKQSKRLIYSGKKETITQVSKLYDMCIKVLTNCVDDLPQKIYIYNLNNPDKFPIAFDLVKPIIERANAKQLENIESYSPDFVAYTDYIWKKVYEKEFKNHQTEEPEEDETWREYYFRKLDEREEALSRTRALIQSRNAQKPTGRVTQQVLSIKMTHAQSQRNLSSTSSVVKSSIITRTSKTLDIVPLKSRNTSQSSGITKRPNGFTSNPSQKTTNGKGALMAKTMKMMKNLRR